MAIKFLKKHADRLRLFPDETDAQLLERLKAQSRGAPQKPEESEADYFRRLVWNAWMRTYMSESEPGKATLRKRAETLRAVRGTDDPRAKNEKERVRRKVVRRSAILAAKKDVPCMDCGGRFPTCVMQFDHRDPSTKTKRFRSPGAMAARTSLEEFEAEIAKCDIVCANCHAIRTHLGRRPLASA